MIIPKLSLREVDFKGDDKINTKCLQDLGFKLKEALSHCGFVYLIDHGVDGNTVAGAMSESRRLFSLSDEEKAKMSSLKTKEQQGYVSPGREIFNREKTITEIREAYDLTSVSPEATFPDKFVPGFREQLTQLAEQTKFLAIKVILPALASALNLDSDAFVKCHQNILGKGNFSKIRSIFYPPLSKTNKGAVRCGEHTDYGTITFLYQDSMGGLEVKNVAGDWIKATPVQNGILMNVGDLLEIFSGGVFPATLHRVVAVDGEDGCRQSIVFFVHPDGETLVKPLIDEGIYAKDFEPISARTHVMNRFQATYEG